MFFRSWKKSSGLRKVRATIEVNDVAGMREALSGMRTGGLLDGVPGDVLLLACDESGRAECLRVLFEFGWDAALDARDGMGRTCLHLAIERGDGDMARVLLNAGADPNARDQDGVTPLNLCKSYHGLSHIARMLLDAGGNPNLVDKHGKNYLM